jgi:hypothetical protein
MPCSICHERGHNARTCPDRPAPSPTAASVPALRLTDVLRIADSLVALGEQARVLRAQLRQLDGSSIRHPSCRLVCEQPARGASGRRMTPQLPPPRRGVNRTQVGPRRPILRAPTPTPVPAAASASPAPTVFVAPDRNSIREGEGAYREAWQVLASPREQVAAAGIQLFRSHSGSTSTRDNEEN